MREFKGFQKGVNLGGWVSQCGNNYNKEHYDSFITEADIDKIATWDVDHVRMPVDYNVIQNDDGSFIESGFAYIDSCLEWCRKNDLGLIIDLHKTCGFVFDNEDCFDFFYEEKYQDMFVSLWKEIASRYGRYSDCVVFELLNEITSSEVTESWNKIAERTVKEIRKIAPDTKIIIGGIFNNSIYGLTLLDKPYDENIVFTYHCYNPLLFTHQKAYWVPRLPSDFEIEYPGTYGDYRKKSQEFFGDDFEGEYKKADDTVINEEFFNDLFAVAVDISEKYDVPLYCGEYGVIDRADCHSALNWFRDINTAFNELNIARAVWSYKEMDFGLTDEHYAPVFSELIKLL